MFRAIALPLVALSALTVVMGCGRSGQPKTSSTSAGVNTPSVSASTTDTGSPTGTATVPVTYAAAESTFQAGHYDEATQLFTTYTESNPDNAWGYYMLGLSSWKSGEKDQALQAFDKALELDPDHRKSLFNSSRVLLEQGQSKEALERIEKALIQEPMSNEGLRLLGRVRHQLGQVDEAIDAYHRALGIDDRDVWSMNNLGLIYIEQERSSEALPPLARAVELRGNAPVFQNNLGMALERSGYPTAAAKAYEAAIGVDSTYRKASTGLARVTGGGQEPESEPVDLVGLARQFEADIEMWRGPAAVSDSSEVVGETAKDSTPEIIAPVNDSTSTSVEAVADTSEGC